MAMKDIILRNRRGVFPEIGRLDRPFAAIQREMDRVFNGFFEASEPAYSRFSGDRFSAFVPDLNVSESEKSVEISAELPGMNETDIEVSVDKNLLTIKGEKKAGREDQNRSYYHRERRFGSFQRSIRLPDEVEMENIQAAFRDGVLVITLPKSEKEQARVIEVKSV